MNKKTIKWIFQILVTIALFYLAIQKIDTDKLTEILSESNAVWFLLVPVIVFFDMWINSYRIVSLYRFYDVNTKIKRVFTIKLQGAFFSLLFPLIGDAYKIQTFKNVYGNSYAKNSLVVLLDRLIFTFALTIILVPVWIGSVIEVDSILKFLIIPLFLLEIIILYAINHPSLIQIFSSLTERIHKRLLVRKYSFEKREGYFSEITKNTLIAVFRHLMTSLMYLVIAIAIIPHFQFSIVLFLLTVFSIILSRIIPVSVGGIGLREYIAVIVFPQIGIETEYAFSIAIIVSLVGISQGIAGGVSYLINRIVVVKGG
ncbi:MAG: lysylphosphatidylglycerol synthase transmembrane domain-containing protein [Bacteroidota bacterium]